MPLRGNNSNVHKHPFSLAGTDPVSKRHKRLVLHRHARKEHTTLQRKTNNVCRAEAIDAARSHFYDSEHEYSEPSSRKHRLPDYFQFELSSNEERPCKPLPRRRAPNSRHPIFKLPDGFWDDASSADDNEVRIDSHIYTVIY